MSAERAPALRIIAAEEWRAQRWGWLEGVRRDAALSATARLVAHVLALDFVNVRTMRCDPGYDEIGTVIGASQPTVKRAVAQLVAAGWLSRAGGMGRGNRSSYGFVTRARIVQLKGVRNDPRKGVRNDQFSDSEKGSKMIPKGVKNDPAHNNAKPWKNHGARGGAGAQAHAGAREGWVSDNPMVIAAAGRAVAAWREGRADAIRVEPAWVVDHILGAGLLTEDEIARLWPGRAEKGAGDDGQ